MATLPTPQKFSVTNTEILGQEAGVSLSEVSLRTGIWGSPASAVLTGPEPLRETRKEWEGHLITDVGRGG